MSWVFLSDDWYQQASLRGSQPEAIDLYPRIKAWCGQPANLTDGLVLVTTPAQVANPMSRTLVTDVLQELLAPNPDPQGDAVADPGRLRNRRLPGRPEEP